MRFYKILIIEDEFSIFNILSYKLRKEHYKVMGANNGHDALKAIPEFMPNLILLDIKLPDISGFDIYKEIKAHYQIPVIMLTSRNSLKDIIYAFELGVEDYITKPFDLNDVLERINCVLRNTVKVPYR